MYIYLVNQEMIIILQKEFQPHCTLDGVNCMENPLHHFSIIDEPKYLLSNASLINSIVAPNSFLRLLSAKVIQAKRGLLHFQRITALLFKFGISWKSNKAKYWHINVVCALCMTMSTIHIFESKNSCIFTKLMKRKLFSIGYFLAVLSYILTFLVLNKKIRICKTKHCYTYFYYLAVLINILTFLVLNKKIRICKAKHCYTWFYTWATINNLTIGLISNLEKRTKNGWIFHNSKRTNFSAL